MSVTQSGIDLFRGTALINITQSATTAATSAVWAIRNTLGTRKITIDRLFLKLHFEGTAAATRMGYEVIKGTGCTAQNGTAVTPAYKVTSQSDQAAAASITYLDTGLSLTSNTWGASLGYVYLGRIPCSTTIPLYVDVLDLIYPRLKEIELAQNEVLGIRLLNQAVINDRLTGFCEFSVKAS